jgi:hypothetical protein
MVINEALARAAFRERDPIGRVIIPGYDSMDPMTIVGVVGDVWLENRSRKSICRTSNTSTTARRYLSS